MASAGLRVALQQHVVIRLQKQQVGGNTGFLDAVDQRRQRLEVFLPVPCVDADRDACRRVVARPLELVEQGA